jgi:hypothetical protein
VSKPSKPGKKSVELHGAPRVSRIRRDPPPKVKEVTAGELEERDAWVVAVGVVAFALAIVAIIFGFAIGPGWSPSQHPINIVSES